MAHGVFIFKVISYVLVNYR